MKNLALREQFWQNQLRVFVFLAVRVVAGRNCWAQPPGSRPACPSGAMDPGASEPVSQRISASQILRVRFFWRGCVFFESTS